MADGDDREESDNQRDDANLPQVGHLQIGEAGESDNLEEEYLALDSQLNQLDACLDSLELRSDDLLSKLKSFLQSGQRSAEEEEEEEDAGDGNSGGGGGATSGNKEADSATASSSASDCPQSSS